MTNVCVYLSCPPSLPSPLFGGMLSTLPLFFTFFVFCCFCCYCCCCCHCCCYCCCHCCYCYCCCCCCYNCTPFLACAHKSNLFPPSATLTTHTTHTHTHTHKNTQSQTKVFFFYSIKNTFHLHNMFEWLSRRRPYATTAYSSIDTDNESLDTPTLHGNKKGTCPLLITSFILPRQTGSVYRSVGMSTRHRPHSSCKSLNGKTDLNAGCFL